MDPEILSLLEWPLISKQLEGHAHFHDTVKTKIFIPKTVPEIQKTLDRTQLLLNKYHSSAIKDISAAIVVLNPNGLVFDCISKASKAAIFDFEQLNQLALGIELYLDNYFDLFDCDFTKEEKTVFHNNKRSYQTNFLKEFRSFVNQDGEIDYFKHPLLKTLYKQKIDLEQNIRRTLQGLMSDSQWGQRLQFGSFDLINDRYVLPVKSDSYQSSLGQIVSRSDSGQTLFVEPIKIKGMNLSRLELVLRLDKELNSLTIKFSKSINEMHKHLTLVSLSIQFLDEYLARMRFAYSNDFIQATLSTNREIIIKGMYHPLIKNPVKNNIEILPESNGMIISGPNTGGKTATLKSIALIQIFLKFGLFIPADSATVHLYEGIHYFGNDGQNLPEGLSSFASEVKNYCDLLNKLSKTNLIIIDEIFNSTSSEEASALALSLFEEISKESDTHFLVSTHHQMLKTLMHDKNQFVSAHVGFDTKTNKPSYILHTGAPGSSQALNIFTKLNDDSMQSMRIVEKAKKILDNKMLNYESLLEKISSKENELDNLLKENKDLNIQIKNKKKSMEGVYQLKLEEKISILETKIKRVLDKAQTHFHKAKLGKIDSKRQLDKKDDEIKSLLFELKPESKKTTPISEKYEHMKRPQSIQVGYSYFSIFLGQTVTVKSINEKKKEAQVTKGLMSIKCPIDSLRVAHKTKGQGSVQVKYPQNSNAKLEYDCRGMRLEEFQSIVESAVSDLMTDSVPFINFIHGHGNGTLKGWLRGYIKKNKSIKADSNDTGNDGETRVVLT